MAFKRRSGAGRGSGPGSQTIRTLARPMLKCHHFKSNYRFLVTGVGKMRLHLAVMGTNYLVSSYNYFLTTSLKK